LNALIQKHQNYIPLDWWKQAQARNPDPTRLVPVPARHFTDITQRIEKQNQRIESMNNFLKVSFEFQNNLSPT